MIDFEKISADLESQPITGYLPDGRYIDMPLISHITDNLYVGGCINNVDLGNFFTHVFSLYKWERYGLDDDTILVEYTMYDDPGKIEVKDDNENYYDISEVAEQVVEALDAGGNVLVHCQAGINRSNLTAALTLMKWKDLTAADAIDMLREKRGPLVLANPGFEKHLRSLDN